MEPLNFKPLVLTPAVIQQIYPVVSLNIFESSTNNFEPNGFFSTEIFGRVGSKERNNTFAYADTKLPIMNPHIFKELISLKGLYSDIIYGIRYAVWDDKTKDFVLSNASDGKTGYSFFLEHIEETIKYQFEEAQKNQTLIGDQRFYKLSLLNKFGIKNTMTKYILISPAGMRDYTIDDNGKPSEDEVNSLYRKLIININGLSNIKITKEYIEIYDVVRANIQKSVQAIYEHYIDIAIGGKNKWLRGRVMKRRIEGSTRNVITPLPINITNLKNNKNHPNYNQTAIGLFQYIKAIEPIFRNRLKTDVIARLIDPLGTTGLLVNKDSGKSFITDIKPEIKELWTSTDGMVNIINRMGQEKFRNEPITLGEDYLINIYDDGNNIRLVFNTEEIDESSFKYLRPVTYAELFYLIAYPLTDRYPGFLTRYPVAGLGGVYPTLPYLKTTIKGRVVNVIDQDGSVIDTVYEFINKKEGYFNSLSPHYSKLARLDADFDGDKVSFTVMHSKESCSEIKDLLKNRSFYVTPDGKLTYSTSNDVLDYTSKTLSKTLEGLNA